MFRAAIAALILAFAAAPASAQDASADGGWTLGSEKELVEFWYKPAPPSGRYARMWARYEFFDDAEGYRSALHFEEFDCEIPAKRTREITLYLKPGLVEPMSQVKKVSPWRMTQTEATDDESVLAACKGKKARPLAEFPAYIAETSSTLVWPELEPLGWEDRASGSRDFRMFVKAEPGAPTQVWLRLERPQPVAGVRSQVQLYEADCKGGKVRTIQRITYAGNNLKGAAVTDAKATEWSEPVPRSNAARALTTVCETPPQ